MLLAAHESRREILGSQSDFCCRRWHPAKTTGVLRIASSVLHILSQTTPRPTSDATAALVTGRKAAQERFSEENFRNLATALFYTGNVFLNSSAAKRPHNLGGTHGTQQAWMNSRNPTTIATGTKHRQPIFLHPTVEDGTIKRKNFRRVGECARLAFMRSRGLLAESVSSLYTKSFPFH